MTDNEIIKALECCTGQHGRCTSCPFSKEGTVCREMKDSYVRDFINRQKAEIERLEKELELARADKIIAETHERAAKKLFKDTVRRLATTKSEAIKEFAERLKEKILPHICCGRIPFIKAEYELDKLVKEMTEV